VFDFSLDFISGLVDGEIVEIQPKSTQSATIAADMPEPSGTRCTANKANK
jgi:hypothetical protein